MLIVILTALICTTAGIVLSPLEQFVPSVLGNPAAASLYDALKTIFSYFKE